LLVSQSAHATVVERVIAVVEDRPILLSDLRRRAKPFLGQLSGLADAQRAAATSQLLSTLLHRMVDEELEHRAAARAHISVTAQEVEDALERVAEQNQVTVDQLVAEAQKTGLDGRGYREEIRRQLLESKLLNLKVQGRIRVTDEDTRALYHRLQLEARTQLEFNAAWIRIAVPSGSNAEQSLARRKLAEALAARAAKGEDFATLARTHSDDPQTRDAGGQLGPLKPGALPLAVDKALLALEVGAVAGPVKVKGDFFVVKLLSRAAETLPKREEALEELYNRVYLEKLELAKRRWLDSLRRQAHVEVRL
jgi:peptidyl-prolyl cis-trans isomerase SurA